MKRTILYTLIAGFIMFSSCKKDETKATFDTTGSYAVPALVSPAANSDIVITADNQATKVMFKWNKSDYKLDLGVTYSLTVDSAGTKLLTLGSTNSDTLVMTYGDLNSKLLEKGFLANVKIPFSVKVTSALDNQGNSLTSEIITVNVTAYKEAPKVPVFAYLYIAGDFQGWDIGNAVPVASVTSNKLYEGYIYVSNGGQYKLYAEKGNWNSTSYGDSGDGTTGILILANYAGSNFSALAGAGYYEVMVDLNTMKWSQTKTTWGIIGDATPGGWGADTQMTYDVTNKVWTVTASMIANGSYKFRANNDWAIDFGLDNKGNLAYADSPVFGYTAGLNNLTVPSDGNYTITLDLSKPGAYTYKAIKN